MMINWPTARRRAVSGRIDAMGPINSKILLLLSIAAIAVPNVCSAQDLDPKADKAYVQKRVSQIIAQNTQKTASAQSIAPKTASTPIAATNNDYLVRFIYFVPTNRTVKSYAISNFQDFAKTCQKFYQSEMARNGHFKSGTTEGKTFQYEKDANGEPVIHIVYGQNNDVYYGDGYDQYNRVYGEVTSAFPPWNHNVLLVATECFRQLPDGSFTGGVFLGGQSGYYAGAGGVGMVGGDALYFMHSATFNDFTTFDGKIVPDLGPYPMKNDVSFPWFVGHNYSEIASSYIGGASHELGHAFGLPHCFVRDGGGRVMGDLMGNGCRGMRGNFANFPDDKTWLFKPETDQIDVSAYFNQDMVVNDSVPPYCSKLDVTLSNPLSSTDKRIDYKIKADDEGGAGLAYVWSLLDPPWSTIDSTVMDETGMVEFSTLQSELEDHWLDPKSYSFEVNVIDKQGNRNFNRMFLQVPSSMSTQFKLNATTWAGIAAGNWCGSLNLRMIMSMTCTNSGSALYPEVEIQPVGTPFTGTPNFTGTGGTYTGDPLTGTIPVTGYCEVTVPSSGRYHWRYRVVANSWDRSAWVSMGTNDPSVMDIGVDITAPTTPVVIDDGQYTNTNTSLRVSWNTEDAESGMKFAMVNVGTSPTDPGSGYLAKWTTITGANTATITGLNLVEGTTYYVYVRSRNNANLQSITGVSNGIRYTTATPKTINQAKRCTDTTRVRIDSVVASTAKSDFSGYFYVQNKDRSAGIRVNYQGSVDFTAGKVMSIVGTLATVDGEKVINATDVMLAGEDRQIRPVAMNARTIGGVIPGVPSVENASGLTNLGLLVEVFGTVTTPGTTSFIVDDGSGPVKVTIPGGHTASNGERYIITGVASTEMGTDGKLIRVIRARKSTDIVPVP